MIEEVTIRWAQVGIGHVIFRDNRKWTVIAAAQPAQFEYGYSGWVRVRAPQGEEHSIAPKRLKAKVVVLIDSDADPIEPIVWADGAVEAALLVEKLGAIELATQDLATGEVWCPWPEGDYGETMLLHLRVAHNLDTTGIDTALKRASAHGRAHDLKYPEFGKGGFTHRHVPEDLSIT